MVLQDCLKRTLPQIMSNILQILYRCPRQACQRAFIGTYLQDLDYPTRYPVGPFLLKNTAPYKAKEPEIPNEIKQISPNYVTVFSQSLVAEGFQLDQIAGVGYRKMGLY